MKLYVLQNHDKYYLDENCRLTKDLNDAYIFKVGPDRYTTSIKEKVKLYNNVFYNSNRKKGFFKAVRIEVKKYVNS